MPVVLTDVDDRGVMTITLADEERRNALSAELTSELGAAFDTADADPSVRVVVLTNTGTTFCAGANLKERSDDASAPPAAVRNPADLFGHIRRSPKPYVGRLAGHCIAGGLGLAASCDISVAKDDAVFGFTEVRIGVAPAVISVVCLPKMRPGEARAAFLRGNRFHAPEAARLGLINAAVAADELDTAVNEIVGDLLHGAPGALAAAKQLLDRVPAMDIDDAFAWTAQLSAELFASDEAREGMSAYLEKRTPPWVP